MIGFWKYHARLVSPSPIFINLYRDKFRESLYNSIYHFFVYYDELTMSCCMENNVDPDQLASQKPADLDLHCFQSSLCHVSFCF